MPLDSLRELIGVAAQGEMGRDNPRIQQMLGWRRTVLKLTLLKRALQAIHHFKRNGRFVGMFPWTVQVQTCSDCNSACRICPHRLVSQTLPQGRMEPELYESIIDECLSRTRLSGLGMSLQNEPLVDPRIYQLLGEFNRRRRNSKAILFLATNGIELTPGNLQRLLATGLDFLQVSVNAYSRAEYERLSPGRSWDTLQRNLDNLFAQDLSRMGVQLSFVRTRSNHDEVERAVRKWRQRGVPTFVHHLSNRAGSLDTYGEHFLEARALSRRQRTFRRLVQRLLPVCPYVFFQASILFNGDVLLCTHDWNRRVILGNVREQTLAEIWNGDAANAARRAWIEGRPEELPACEQCTVYQDLAFT